MNDVNENEVKFKFKDFEEFKEEILQKLSDNPRFDYDELSESELNSNAVLGPIERGSSGIVDDLIEGFNLLRLSSETPRRQQFFWSQCAGELDDREAGILISYFEKHFGSEYFCYLYQDFILPFALKNETAWKRYGKELMELNIPDKDLLIALSKVPYIDDRVLPLMHKVLGKEFTDIYLANKKLIDKAPRKYHFTDLKCIKEWQITNFLNVFDLKLRKLTADFGEDSNDYYCISKAFKKEGYKEAAHQLLQTMLAQKDKYTDSTENHSSNYFVRDYFPELVDMIKKAFPLSISAEKLEETAKICHKEEKIKRKLIKVVSEELNYIDESNSWLEEIVAAKPDNIEQAKKATELRHKFNSSFSAADWVMIAKYDMPEWMYPVVLKASANRVISLDKPGSVKNLFDAAKAWKINAHIWKKDAELIGRMPLEARIVAGRIFDIVAGRIFDTLNCQDESREQQREIFWQKMKKAQDMGWKEAIKHYAYNDAETRGRILTLYHPEFSKETQELLRSCVRPKDLIDFDMEAMNTNLDLWQQYLGINKQALLPGDFDENVAYDQHTTRRLIKRLTVFDKIFPNKEFKQKFLQAAQKNENSAEAILWLPYYLSDEKLASFAKFLENNLFYTDRFGREIMRPFEQLKDIGKLWKNLTPQQENHNFSKLLGTFYTQDTVFGIDESFDSYKYNHIKYELPNGKMSKGQLVCPENLRLYQKYLISEIRPETQKDFDNLLSLDRKEGMKKLAKHIKDQNLGRGSFVDLVIGNDADINKFEREQIAQLDAEIILNFRSQNYKEIIDKTMGLLMTDPKAGELFRKHYELMDIRNNDNSDPDILNVKKQYQVNKDWIVPSSIKAMLCFGNDYQRYLNKINKYNLSVKMQINQNKPNVSQADIINLHDALYWLPDNIKAEDRKSFMELIDKNLFYPDGNGITRHRNFAELEIIAKAWPDLSPEEKKNSYKDLLACIRSKKYPDCKYPLFAEEAARWGVSREQYKQLENIYEQGLQVPELIDSSQRFCHDDLVGRFLPREDPRTGFFGKWTDCCQHFDSVGKSCAISSMRDPFSQLFVVENKAGRIVAGSWVWASKTKKDDKYYNALCFDNIEAIGDYNYSDKVIGVYKETLPYLAKLNYAKVTVGMGYQDGNVSEFPKDQDPVPLNKNYSGYTDSREQKVMMENPSATPVDYNDGDIYIAGALQTDIPDMQRVSNICFPSGDRELQVPEEDAQGLILKDKGQIVGYVIWSEKEHSVYDMAVLPEYRKDKNASSFKLINEMARRIKRMGGEWTAELRDNTSLRYMQAMANRNLINLEVGDIDHIMSDGTKVYKVKFSVKDIPQKTQTAENINHSRFNEGR